MPVITPQNAREMAQKSHEARRLAKLAAESPVNEPQIAVNVVAERIAHAIELTLDQLEDAGTLAKDRQALATSLRSLRETYHMVTGDALPGRLKPESTRRQARYWERPAGAVTDAPIGSVPPTKP